MNVSGIGGGFDWQELVKALVDVERIPQTRLRSEQSTVDRKIDIYGQLQSKLEEMQKKLEDLDDGDLYYGRMTSVGDPESSIFTASAENRTVTGNYTFQVENLATRTVLSGTSDAGNEIDPSMTLAEINFSTPITDGEITINGARITVDRTQTLQSLMDDIATQTAAAGNEVTATYNASTDRIEMTSANGQVIVGSSTDDSNFLAVTRLTSVASGTSTSAQLGAVNLNAALDGGLTGLRNTLSGSGSFFINGEEILYDTAEDSMREIMNRINESDAGVSIAYDPSNDRFSIENQETGAIGMALDDNGSGFFAAVGISTSAPNYALGENASFKLNGGNSIISTSNTLTEDVHGVTGLSVTARNEGTDTVNVESNAKGAREKIDAFIEAYNDLQQFLDVNTRVEVNADKGEVQAALFAGNSDMSQLVRTLRTALFQTPSGLDGTVKRLQDIGIDFRSGTNQLEIEDPEEFNDRLKENASAISEMFTDASEGLVKRIDDLIENYVKSDGTIDTLTESLSKQSRRLNTQIGDLDRLIGMREQQLTENFLRMEQMQSNMNNQLSLLTSI